MFFGSDFPASMMVSMNTNATVIFVPGMATSCIMKDVASHHVSYSNGTYNYNNKYALGLSIV